MMPNNEHENDKREKRREEKKMIKRTDTTENTSFIPLWMNEWVNPSRNRSIVLCSASSSSCRDCFFCCLLPPLLDHRPRRGQWEGTSQVRRAACDRPTPTEPCGEASIQKASRENECIAEQCSAEQCRAKSHREWSLLIWYHCWTNIDDKDTIDWKWNEVKHKSKRRILTMKLQTETQQWNTERKEDREMNVWDDAKRKPKAIEKGVNNKGLLGLHTNQTWNTGRWCLIMNMRMTNARREEKRRKW